MKQCHLDNCFAPETTCSLGHLNLVECPSWKTTEQRDHPDAESSDEIVFPWSGGALGLTDLGFVAGRGKPTIVGLIGPENAGKTTILAAWYLLTGRGVATSDNYHFANSFTLSGWEAVGHAMQWAPGSPPEFPAHTSSRGGRGQGLLHLAFREDGELARDYLFTDAPGTWFQRWAVNENAADAVGARWISEHADIFLLVADCAALSEESRGSTRASLQLMARRLAAARRGRPVLLVWAKSDIEISQEIEEAVREAVHSQIPDAEEFRTSIRSHSEPHDGRGLGLTTLLDRVLQLRRLKQTLTAPQADSSDPLFIFGTR